MIAQGCLVAIGAGVATLAWMAADWLNLASHAGRAAPVSPEAAGIAYRQGYAAGRDAATRGAEAQERAFGA
jgi:hypothetical protein